MKKLLSMALAMMLLFASVGVYAEGEATEVVSDGNNTSLVWAWDFEETNVGLVGAEKLKTQKEGVLGGGPGADNSLFYLNDSRLKAYVVSKESENTMEGFEAASGTHALRVDPFTYKFMPTMTTPHVIPLEKDTLYKFSFKYAVTGVAAAVAQIGIENAEGSEVLFHSADANWGGWIGAPIPSGSGEGFCEMETTEDGVTSIKTMRWNTYEIYFKSKSIDVQNLKIGLGVGKNTSVTFYDDLKLEKVKGSTDVLFSTNGNTTSSYTSMTAKNYVISGSNVGVKENVNIVAYPFCVLKKPALEMNSTNVNISVVHVPETETETIHLLVGQYKIVDGKEQLMNIWSKPVTFTAATKKDAATEAVTEYYYAENMLQNAVLSLTGLEEVTDSYLQAFVMDKNSGLRPVGGKTVLAPAAKNVTE